MYVSCDDDDNSHKTPTTRALRIRKVHGRGPLEGRVVFCGEGGDRRALYLDGILGPAVTSFELECPQRAGSMGCLALRVWTRVYNRTFNYAVIVDCREQWCALFGVDCWYLTNLLCPTAPWRWL